MHRRTFLGAALAGLGGITLPVWAKQAAAGITQAPLDLATGQALSAIPKLLNRSERAGLFRATLTAAPLALPLIPNQPPTIFWAYNASLPGPLIEAYEGDEVEITFINRLQQPSTIHWHGLPVPPQQDGNPWDLVPPGGRRIYRFNLPAGSAGSYWYHPHPHHYTAEQAFRGLAGPFLVRPRQDPLADIPERLLVVSDLKLDTHAAIASNDANDWMNGREGQFALVNAQHQPVLTFAAGGRERWRICNACSARYLRLTLPGSTFTLVGTDGGLLAAPQAKLSEYLLVPGQRVELVVDANERRDRPVLMAAIYARGKMGTVPPEQALPLLTVDFAGVAGNSLPDIPAVLRPIADLGAVISNKQIVLSENMTMRKGRHHMRFMVNGKTFDMKRVDLISRLNEVEQWELVNRSDMDHPFHLHGTQFQVVEHELNGKITPAPFLAWHDTVNLRANETVRIKTVQHARGLRMFHCHILEHEDMGMMGMLKVI